MPYIYMPEWEHAEHLVDAYAPEPSRNVPSGGRGFWDWYNSRHELLQDAYIAMQVLSDRMDSERRLSYDDVLKCLKGRVWAFRALLAPLPDRPPLLHTGCEPCSFEGCSNCPDAKCACTTGKQDPETAYRICLNR